MGRTRTILISIFIICCVISCKEPFTADALFEETNFLVVEGYINVGPGTTTITLSRTGQLSAKGERQMEANAVVKIEGEDNSSHLLTTVSKGVYRANLNLPSDIRYRLYVKTVEGKEYVSEYTTPIQTPAIDSVFWTYDDAGVHIQLASHDPSNSTRYYQWDYKETWMIKSEFTSFLGFEEMRLYYLLDEERDSMRVCWKNNLPNDLLIHSTASLTDDQFSTQMFLIIKGNERLGVRYSINVNQHALDRKGYDYLQLMKKNTGPLGSFSDPQPSELVGNIKCLTSDEPVVGYITAATTSSQRIYIDNAEVPHWNFEIVCKPPKTTTTDPDSLIRYLQGGFWIPLSATQIDQDTGEILEFTYAPDYCVDCRSRNGVSTKPDFWQ